MTASELALKLRDSLVAGNEHSTDWDLTNDLETATALLKRLMREGSGNGVWVTKAEIKALIDARSVLKDGPPDTAAIGDLLAVLIDRFFEQ